MMNNGLFDNVGLLRTEDKNVPSSLWDFGNDNGVYLETIELQNWGPFSGITEIPLQGLPALLVGENGTGKSSLMDAILTLLVSRDLHYNSASDNKGYRADERTLMEYVLGVSGSSLSEDSGWTKKQTRYLRETGELSIILLRFRSGTDFLTVANVFLADTGRKDPQRFYLYAKRPLSIAADFTNAAGTFEEFRTAMGRKEGVTVTADKARYFQFVRAEIGLVDDNSMKLLNSLSSMKSLPKPDEFIRTHMLPSRQNYKGDYDKMKRAFSDIAEIGRHLDEVLKRQRLLGNAVPYIKEAGKAKAELAVWDALGSKVRPYVYQIGERVALQEKEALEEKKASLRKKEDEKRGKAEELAARIVSLKDKRAQAGGGQLIEKKLELAALEKEKTRREHTLGALRAALEPVGVNVTIETETAFNKMFSLVKNRKNEIASMMDSANVEKIQADRECRDASEMHRKLERARDMAGKDKVFMDEKLVHARDRICRSLGVGVGTLPFLGEFLSVKEGEESWRPVIEHVLHKLSQSVLLPEEMFLPVTECIRNMERSGADIRYIVMNRLTEPVINPKGNITPAWQKLDVKDGHPYSGWVKEFLKRYAVHYCCETPKEFVSCYPAIMEDGQARSSKRFGGRNDRVNIFDPKNFVMSGSFEAKKKALEEAVNNAAKTLDAARSRFGKAAGRARELEAQKQALDSIPYISSFEEINVAGITVKIESCRETVQALENSKDIAQINARIQEAEEKRAGLEEAIAKLRDESESVAGELRVLEEQMASYGKVLAETVFSEDEKNLLHELYVKYCPASANPKFESVMGTCPKMLSSVTRKVTELTAEYSQKREGAERMMRLYLEEFKGRSAELMPSMGRPGEAEKFIAEYEKVKDDMLPVAKEKFHEQETVSKLQEIRQFLAVMEAGTEQDIKKAVEDINYVLKQVPYSQDVNPTFLQVECHPNKSGDVTRFRQMIKDLSASGVFAPRDGMTDEIREGVFAMMETFFNFVDSHVGRIRKTDVYSEDNILDPRNWYVFPVCVCREETMGNGEKEIVQVKALDKTNKQSSGEGEKFTYFILAACFAIWMHLLDPDYIGRTFRFLMIDEIGNKLSPSNLHDVIALFGLLRIQLVSILPQGDKVSEYEGFVGNIMQTDWLDKPTGVSFVDTISLASYIKKNKELLAQRLAMGKAAKELAEGDAG